MSDIKLPEAPIGTLDSFEEQVKLVFDLIALAYRADLTRVVSYMMVSEGTNRTYNHIGVSDSFHPVSHHANDLGRIEKLVKIQTWHMDRFAEFLGKLAEVRDGEGTLLDNSIFLYGSNMSNSDRHNGHPLPTILVGGGGGKLTGGRHIELPEPTPLANLHLTILGKAGVEQKSFGDSTGTIAGVVTRERDVTGQWFVDLTRNRKSVMAGSRFVCAFLAGCALSRAIQHRPRRSHRSRRPQGGAGDDPPERCRSTRRNPMAPRRCIGRCTAWTRNSSRHCLRVEQKPTSLTRMVRALWPKLFG